MALVNCPECNKEISDQSTNCPHCGFPLKKSQNDHLLNSKSTFGKNNVLIVAISSVVIIALVMTFFLFNKMKLDKKDDQKANQANEQNEQSFGPWEQDFSKVSELIISSEPKLMDLIHKTSEVWNRCNVNGVNYNSVYAEFIHKKSTESLSFSGFSDLTGISDISDSAVLNDYKIGELVKNLSSPPSEYKSMYDSFLSFYAAYQKLYSFALFNTSGNLEAYVSEGQDITSEYAESRSKLEIEINNLG